MSLSPNFSVAQTPLNPSLVIFTDTSTGSDPSITERRIYVTDSNGNPVVPSGTTTNYITWILATNPLSVDLLTQDLAVNIRVDWVNVSGLVTTVVATLNQNYCFSLFNKQFLYYLVQLQSTTYNIIQDTNYWGNVGIFWSNITGAINAVEIGNDIAASQACLSRATYMAQNQANYF